VSRRAATVVALLVTVAVVAGVFVRGFVYPVSDQPFDEGPVVVLGDDPRRVEWALETLPGPSDQRELILSHPNESAVEDLGAGCALTSIRCVRPVPVSTWGEAQEVATLAHAEGWLEVTVVTSRFHLSRSRLLFERCVDVPVALVGPQESGRVPIRLALREAAATLVSALGYHDC
jgi:hypothetical protein